MVSPCVFPACFTMVVIIMVIILRQQASSRSVHVHCIVAGEKKPYSTSYMDTKKSEEYKAKTLQQHSVAIQFLLF